MGEKWVSGRSENWGGWKWAFSVFLGIMLLHSLAILLFTRGFLLTRSELSQYSQCNDVEQSPCFAPPHEQNASRSCWTKPAVDRLVIIVLDALRFDFVAPSSFFAERKPWMDKFQVLHELASRNQSSARIFKAIADPPTTSLQRLKGLATGGLPTFIDVGNSFGAPAIVEDNLIHQLVQNGKRVVMMGDDTWVQLFPHHFDTSYPFPSFNVKDLHTVDNGCITNLFPTLYKDDWDVLIAHFLGVDHAGHIFGVDSTPMMEKLEQYNEILKKVVGVLESQSGPGGLHENTMLLVMGDHGQTMNGDHGGGTAEEVETAIFALSLKKPPTSLPAAADSLSCQLDMHGRRVCIDSIQQLDFAATVSALLGVPFPFGSIGRVSSQLISLAGGTWNQEKSTTGEDQSSSHVDNWLQNYVNVLCINSWQVKKYIDVYSSLSLIGFSEKDLLHVSDLYSEAQELWSNTSKNISLDKSERAFASLPLVKRQLDAYSMFLESVAALARSNWTEFNLKMMGVGFCIMLSSLCLHVFLIKRLDKLCGLHSCSGYSRELFGVHFACIVVLIRACSFLSNSFILEEGRVASFLLATTAIFQLRCAIMKKRMLREALLLCLLVPLLRISIELGQLKQAVNSLFLKVDPSKILGIDNDSQFWMYVAEVLPIVALIVVAFIMYRSMSSFSSQGIVKYVVAGTLFNYMLIPLHWASDSSLFSVPMFLEGEMRNLIPRLTYAAGLLQLSMLAIDLFVRERALNLEETTVKALALLSAWSSTIIVLSGKQGPLVVLALFIGGWCIIRLMALEQDAKNDSSASSLSYALPVTQWSLMAVCMFFSTGHWCAFDGLRYAAAFVGFDEFNLIRQAILLTIDTFGFSHILPIFALPLLVVCCYPLMQNKQIFSMRLSQVYLMYGFITAITVTFTMLCVTIQRRHLMVWGLFAPKFVFDVVGLLLGDILTFLAALYYIA
ncbi:Glycosylphosphatidylinositol anchor synthesis protein [Handroanthus impetiginosus]|uniref:Glycosylphosphatidylinositol anchor synthesis protein n=1 Tax=Handroanthus impetiginosus TaxID=429701 RepID=A0A2G9H730_9LAMI|nr:Glycosylphosphatidylinositol anchor synthesis protein [Handroanthus impetiginosus]